MKRTDVFWCIECDEIFERDRYYVLAQPPPLVCPSCTNRSNLMPLVFYIGNSTNTKKTAKSCR